MKEEREERKRTGRKSLRPQPGSEKVLSRQTGRFRAKTINWRSPTLGENGLVIISCCFQSLAGAMQGDNGSGVTLQWVPSWRLKYLHSLHQVLLKRDLSGLFHGYTQT